MPASIESRASFMSSSPMRLVMSISASMAPRSIISTSAGKSRSGSVDPYTHPVSVFMSKNISIALKRTSSVGEPAPTRTQVPPRRVIAKACSIVAEMPTTSKV